APVVKFTLAGRKGSEVDGLVELLNNKVLDPRLLKKLLRLQAAVILKFCFESQLKSFRFNHSPELPPLFNKLPLESSLLGLLVESALISDFESIPEVSRETGFERRTIRGQNLDRAGLSSRHMKLMSLVAEPATIPQLASQLGWPEEEVCRVVRGFELAELIQKSQVSSGKKVFGVIRSKEFSQKAQSFFKANGDKVNGRVVRDLLGLKLLLRRSRPDVLLFENSDESMVSFISNNQEPLKGIRVVAIAGNDESVTCGCHAVMGYDADAQQFGAALGADVALPVAVPAVSATASPAESLQSTGD
ncbi:MAG: hypothetical protein AAF497_29760, partial [Planctomycetota bacterium]